MHPRTAAAADPAASVPEGHGLFIAAESTLNHQAAKDYAQYVRSVPHPRRTMKFNEEGARSGSILAIEDISATSAAAANNDEEAPRPGSTPEPEAEPEIA